MSEWTREQLEEGRIWRRERAREWRRLHPWWKRFRAKPLREHVSEFLGWFVPGLLFISALAFGPPLIFSLFD